MPLAVLAAITAVQGDPKLEALRMRMWLNYGLMWVWIIGFPFVFVFVFAVTY
jgi:hypothetical protein